ncbi:MAG: acetyl-CoA C-acyltransferase [Chitinophagales bacterium]|nr:acetyl-CoA C-acyltransferase [Chitinophagales bacterium]
MKEVFIVSVARTPVGAASGSLASLTATQLGSVAMKAALERAQLNGEEIDEIFMGNVLSANVGQAPVTQAMIGAGISNKTPGTTVNKVCASGMKAIMLGAQSIMTGENSVVMAGGMESMSNAPYYLDKARTGYRMGHGQIIDGMIKDGLWDPYGNVHMGNCGEVCAKHYNFTREAQDEYSINTYKRAQEAYAAGMFANEIVPVEVKGKETVIISEDEQYKKVKFDKIPTLKPAFAKDGTVTAANASPISDGASAVVLMSGEEMNKRGLKPIAKIIGFADAAQAPEWFTTAPSIAVPKALKMAGISIEQVDFFEVNEAFAVVSMANARELNIPMEKVNAWGGAIALGHALGNSGARITITLSSILKAKGAKYGVAGICNGGGGASAIVIEAC